MGKVCVIGAGSSGIASCQVLQARGIDFDCFEKGSGVGGNWRYGNDNGMSSAYRSLFINTSRRMMQYATYPMPEDYPDYPHHEQIAAYFDDYVDHFGFRDRIRFNTEVERIEPDGEGRWTVTTSDGASDAYDAVFVANGHHWNPKWPDPPFPGQETFTGEQLHSHHYREPDERFAGKRVLVLGIGNSATDISVESSRHAEMTYLAMRRGAHVIPKYIAASRPTSSRRRGCRGCPSRSRAGSSCASSGRSRATWRTTGCRSRTTARRGPIPRLLRPAAADRPRAITPKPNISRIDGGTVHFVDGSSAEIDTIVWCTGYRITFPFLDSEVMVERRQPRAALPARGAPRPPGALLHRAGAAARRDHADRRAPVGVDRRRPRGKVPLPDAAEMRAEIAREEAAMRRRYVASTRHTIQVDFHPYMRLLRGSASAARACRIRSAAPRPPRRPAPAAS